MTVEDFPYTPGLRIESLWYLDKLRAIPDRRLARQLFKLYTAIMARQPERDGKSKASGE